MRRSKLEKDYFIRKKRYVGIFMMLSAFSLLVILSSCSGSKKFMRSEVVPAAEGSVKISRDKNDNYRISLEVIRLAEPDRLSPPRKVYVIWMYTEDDALINLGNLKSDSGLFSGSLKASFETVSAFKPARIFITAEDEPNILNPQGAEVLRSEKL